MRPNAHWRALLVGVLLALAVALAACGGDDDEGGGGSGEFGAVPETQDTEGKKGGTLTVLNASDVDSMDPAVTYYQFRLHRFFAMQDRESTRLNIRQPHL